MNHIEKANEFFAKNFHCSQAVFAAFAEELGITEEQALKIGACFGSGMRKGEVCGACTGALMALGLKYGQADEADMKSRMKTNEVSDRFMNEFKAEHGSYICKELLKCDLSTKEGIEYALENKLFTEFCPKMVESATAIAEKIMSDNENKMFLSEFCEVKYDEQYNVVFVKWKKFCSMDDYRKPLEYALDIIKEYKCNYVADTRDGFENIPEDTAWVADYFMPEAVIRGCECIYFIIDEDNSLKEELEGQAADSANIIQFKYIYDI
ncbi:MAG: C_GCAxxG_C_C family protein, partial [Lachnospiraceae bacterium]|nr:C_GCAxxG_C_C family protein [Lachnospiraceae bacterium]